MSLPNKVATTIIDKNGFITTRHKNPDTQDIKNRLKSIGTPQPIATLDASDDLEQFDRASLYIQEYTITKDNIGKFQHIINKANNRLERNGVEERFTYTLEADIINNGDGTHREVIIATLNKPKISNGDWTFSATHEFTPAGDVVSYWSEGADYIQPEDSHCDHCGKNRKRERVYTVTNEEGETKQIGSSCLELFMGMRPEGLWSLSDTKIEDSLSELESLSLSGGDGIRFPLRNIIGVALNVTNNGENYVPRAAARMNNPATAQVVDEKLSLPDQKFDEALIDSVIEFVRSLPEDDSDYVSNLKSVFGARDLEEGNFVKRRHLGQAASSVSAWYRAKNKQEKVDNRKPYNQEFMGTPKERIKDAKTVTVDKRFSYPNDFGTVVGYILRDEEDHLILWKSASSGHPEIWEGASLELNAFTVKSHEWSKYENSNQTTIQRGVVKSIKNVGDAPVWKVNDIVYDAIRSLPPEDREPLINDYEAIFDFTEQRKFATDLTGIEFS